MNDLDRGVKRNKLSEYVMNEFQAMINNELSKYEKENENLLFAIDNDKWKVKTAMETLYDDGGWYTYEEEESIIHVSVKGRMYINGAPRGTIQTINFSPTTGFYDLKRVIVAAREDDTRVSFGGPEDKFKISRIMHEDFNVGENDRWADHRTEEIEEILREMKVPKGLAKKLANKVVTENPDNNDVSDLVSKCMAESYS